VRALASSLILSWVLAWPVPSPADGAMATGIIFDEVQVAIPRCAMRCGFPDSPPGTFNIEFNIVRNNVFLDCGKRQQCIGRGLAFRIGYLGPQRYFQDYEFGIVAIGDIETGKVFLLDPAKKVYLRVTDKQAPWFFGEHERPALSDASALKRRIVPHILRDLKINGIVAHGESDDIFLKGTEQDIFSAMRGKTLRTPFTAHGRTMFYARPDIREWCVDFDNPFFANMRRDDICSEADDFILYFRVETLADTAKFTFHNPTLVIQRGNIQLLGAEQASLFRVPPGYENVCAHRTLNQALSQWCAK